MSRSILHPLLVLLGCAAMALVEGVLQPIYPIKSALKWVVFGGCAALYAALSGERQLFSLFRRPTRNAILPAAVLAIGVFVFIWSGYLVLAPWLDLSAITGALGAKEGITAPTFPLVALYISLCNSLLEEFFFRGFAFLGATGRSKAVWLFSSLAFALYHVAIMGSWFHPVLFALLTAGLMAAGLLFNALDREGTIWPAWLVHMAANLAINTIGLRLFGIL